MRSPALVLQRGGIFIRPWLVSQRALGRNRKSVHSALGEVIRQNHIIAESKTHRLLVELQAKDVGIEMRTTVRDRPIALQHVTALVITPHRTNMTQGIVHKAFCSERSAGRSFAEKCERSTPMKIQGLLMLPAPVARKGARL